MKQTKLINDVHIMLTYYIIASRRYSGIKHEAKKNSFVLILLLFLYAEELLKVLILILRCNSLQTFDDFLFVDASFEVLQTSWLLKKVILYK